MPTFKNTQRGTWYCKFYYTDWKGVRKQKKKEGFQTKRDSQEWERNFLNRCSIDSDITYENNTVSVTKSYARYNGEDLIQTPKTPKSNRVITLPEPIMEQVKKAL